MSLLKFLFPLFALTSLEANTVLITGANRGLGLEFARQYHAKGYKVIGTARRPEEASDLQKIGVQVEKLDVTDPASVAALAEKLKNVPIDILINNAGVFLDKSASLETLDFDDLAKTFAVNSIGPMRMSQALLPNLRAGKQKKIINITSNLGSIQDNTGGMYSYRASKAALNQLNKSMSHELGREGFISLAIHPGWVRTDMGGPRGTYSPEESISAMIKVIDQLDKDSNGRFLDLHGQQLPW